MNRCPLSGGGNRTVNGWKWVVATATAGLSSANWQTPPTYLIYELDHPHTISARMVADIERRQSHLARLNHTKSPVQTTAITPSTTK